MRTRPSLPCVRPDADRPKADGSGCSNHCGFCFEGMDYTWQQIEASETVTLATVIEIINTNEDTTRTSTLINEVPEGYTLPPTNADGTQIAVVTYITEGDREVSTTL